MPRTSQRTVTAPPRETGLVSFRTALRRAVRGSLDLRTALSLLQGARAPEDERELFATAAGIRDDRLGRVLQLTAHVHMVTRCEISPSCRYCSLSSTIPRVQDEREKLTTRDLLRAVRYVSDRGVRSMVLVGGTDPAGADTAVRKVVRAVREVSDVELAIDVGPSLAPETVDWLRRQNAGTIYCSVETVNPRVFRHAKPGDDLSRRMAFNVMLERHGATLGNVVMNGLGRPADLLSSILSLRRFRRLAYLYISTFHPVRGTPWSHRQPGSLRTSLRALAIARLAFPKVQIGLAEVEVEDPGSAARTGPQLRAGAGNTFAGILIYRRRTVDVLDPIRQEATRAGFVVS